MAELENEWELASDFTQSSDGEDIKKKNTEKSGSESQAGYTPFLKSDSSSTSKTNGWEQTLPKQSQQKPPFGNIVKESELPKKEEKPKLKQPVLEKPISKEYVEDFLTPEGKPVFKDKRAELEEVGKFKKDDVYYKTVVKPLQEVKSAKIKNKSDYQKLEQDFISLESSLKDKQTKFEQVVSSIENTSESDPIRNVLIQEANQLKSDYEKEYATLKDLDYNLKMKYREALFLEQSEDFFKKGGYGMISDKAPKETQGVVESSVRTGVKNLLDSGAGFIQAAGNFTNVWLSGGYEDNKSKILEKATNVASNSLRNMSESIPNEIPSDVENSLSYKVLSNGLTMAPMIATAAVTGGAIVPTFLASYAQSTGDLYNGIKEKFPELSDDKASVLAVSIGLPIAMLDAMSGTKLTQAAKQEVKESVLKKLADININELTLDNLDKTTLKSIIETSVDATQRATKSVVEGIKEEVPTEIRQELLSITAEESAENMAGREIENDYLSRLEETAIVSGILGGGIKTITNLVSDGDVTESDLEYISRIQLNEEEFNSVQDKIDALVKSGKLSEEQGQSVYDKLAAISETNSVLPPDADNKSRANVINIIQENNKLRQESEKLPVEVKASVESQIKDNEETVKKIITNQALTDDEVLETEYKIQKDERGLPVFLKEVGGKLKRITREVFEKEFNQKNKLLKEAAKVEQQQAKEEVQPVTEQATATEGEVQTQEPTPSSPQPSVEIIGEDLDYKKKQEARQELDDALAELRKASSGLGSFGQFQALPQFVKAVRAYLKNAKVNLEENIDEAIQFLRDMFPEQTKDASDGDIKTSINDIASNPRAELKTVIDRVGEFGITKAVDFAANTIQDGKFDRDAAIAQAVRMIEEKTYGIEIDKNALTKEISSKLDERDPFLNDEDLRQFILSYLAKNPNDYSGLFREVKKQNFKNIEKYSSKGFLNKVNDVIKTEEAKVKKPEFTKEQSKEVKKGVKNINKESGKGAAESWIAMNDVAQEIGWKKVFGQKIAKIKENFSDKFSQQAQKHSDKIEKAKARLEKTKEEGKQKLFNQKEKSKERIAAIEENNKIKEQIRKEKEDLKKEFRNYIDDLLKYPSFRDNINNSDATLSAISKRVNNVTTQKKMDAFIDYLLKLAEDGKYNEKVEKANEIRSEYKKATSKSMKKKLPANVYSLLDKVSKVDTEKLSIEDLDKYLDIVNKIGLDAKGVSVKGGDIIIPGGSMSGIVTKEVEDFINEMIDKYKQESPDNIIKNYSTLSKYINPEKLSELIDDLLVGNITETRFNETIGEAKEEVKKELKLLATSGKSELSKIDTSGLTETESSVLSTIKSADLDLLSEKDLIELINTQANILDGNFFGSGKIVNKINAAKDIQNIIDNKNNYVQLGNLTRSFISQFSNKPMMYEFVTKTIDSARKLATDIGFNRISSKAAEAKNIFNKYKEGYDKIVKDYAKKGIDLTTPDSRFRRGVYAYLVQSKGISTEEAQLEFEERIKVIENNIEQLKNSLDSEQKARGEVLDRVFSKIQNKQDKNAFIKEFESKYSADSELVKYAQENFAKHKDKFKENSEIYNNKEFEEWNNYTPQKMEVIEGGKDEDVDVLDLETISGQRVSQSQAKSSITRRKTSPVKGMVVDFDFDYSHMKEFKRQLLDSYVQKETQRASDVFKSSAVKESVGLGNYNMLKDALIDKINSDYGRRMSSDKKNLILDNIMKVTNTAAARAIRGVLGGVDQVFKQFFGVITDAVVSGMKPKYFSMALNMNNDQDVNDLIMKYPIGERMNDSPNIGTKLSEDELTRTKEISKVLKGIKETDEKYGEYLFSFLKKSDNNAAKLTWLSFYLESLEKQGIDINSNDWKTNPNDEAANYAEQQVSRMQSISDKSLAAEIVSDRSTRDKLIKDLFFPMASFSINNQMRMLSDLQKARYGDKESARRLAGYMSGIVTYNAIKIYFLAFLSELTAEGILDKLGLEEAPEEEDKYEKMFDDFFKSSLSDALAQGIPVRDLAEKMVNEMIIFSNKEKITEKKEELKDEKDPDNKEQIRKEIEDLKKGFFTTYSNAHGWGTGIYSILLRPTQKFYEHMKKDETELTEAEKKAYEYIAIGDALAAIGLMGGYTNSIKNKLRKEVDASVKQRKDILGEE